MHIASALTLARRDSVRSDVAVTHGGRLRETVLFQAPKAISPSRKLLPGAILVAALVAIGGLFPILF